MPSFGHRTQISELSEWVRCPNCFLDLEPVADRTLGCATGHRFDLHRHGYATLLPPKAPPHHGDTREMLVDRDAVLGSGLYAPISDAVIALALPALVRAEPPAPASSPRGEPAGSAPAHSGGVASDALRLVDFGCGTGHYSRAVASAAAAAAPAVAAGAPAGPGPLETSGAAPDLRVLMTDRSPAAVRWSTLALPASSGVVLDVWSPLPLRNAIADVALDVFAPRNPAEFARVLRPGGRLIVVVPRAEHLLELRADGAMLDVPEGKADAVVDQFAPLLHPVERIEVVDEITLSAAQAAAIRRMGPAGHHAAPDASERRSAAAATIAVDVIAFSHAEASPAAT